MKPALITVVNPQDNDVIGDQLIYYKNIGISNFYIMLHMPDFTLMSICESFRDKFAELNINLFINAQPEHHHEKDCKKLSDSALEDGCDWIIGSDADELLILKRHKTIQEFLSEYNDTEIVLHYKWIDYRADKDVYSDAFINMKYRCKDYMDVTDAGWIKTCGKFNNKMSFITGFHNIEGCDNIIKINPEIAFFAHFPERNFEQYDSKTKLQRKNWINKYGFFYMDKDLEKDPDFLKKIWPDRLITVNGQRQICNNDKSLKDNNKMEYIFDPLPEELFRND